MIKQNIKENNYMLMLIVAIFLVLIILFFYFDRHNQLSVIILTWGPGGIILSILLMAAISMSPIPGEGLLILLLKIYGIYEGTLYSWIGSIISSLVIFYLARYYGQSFFRNMISPHRFDMVDHWVSRKGTLGLFIARLLPIPAFAVNYITGVMPSVRFWPYTWTAALSIIPYYIGTALVYAGAAKSTRIWLVVGGGTMIILWITSYILGRKEG